MQLQEREESLEVLRDGFDRACGGEGRCVVVQGEAGIGKTTLLRAFLDSLGTDLTILRGSCEDLAIAEPLGPLRDLAREAGWRLTADLSEAGSRIAAFSDVLTSLDAATTTTLIVVEDLHWADAATIDFLKFLARRMERRRLLLLVTARNDGRGRANVRHMLSGVSPDHLTRIDVKPLSRSAVAALSQGSGIDADAIFRVSNGNAFYVSEILKSGLAPVPRSLEDAVLARLDVLGAAARKLVAAASIFPRRAEISMLSRIAGENFETVAEECVLGGILEADGEFLAFRHEIARLAVEASLSPTMRRQLHLTCLSLLEAGGSVHAARRLHHAKQVGDEATLRGLAPIAAQEAVKMGAMREAAEYFELAIEHEETRAPVERAALLERAAWAHYLVGNAPRSIALQSEALHIYHAAGDTLREGDSYRRLSRFHWLATKIARARELADTAVRVLAQHRGPELAMALSTQAQLAMLNRTFAIVGPPAREAIVIAREFDRPDIESHALNNLGQSLAISDPDQGREMLRESIDIALRLEDVDNVARGYTNTIYYEMEQLDFVRAEEAATAGIAYSVEHELDGYRRYQSGSLAWVLLRIGRWQDAARLTETHLSQELPDDEGLEVATASWAFPAACALTWISIRKGEPVPSHVSRFLSDFMTGADELQRLHVHAAILAELSWHRHEDPELAIAALRKVLDRAENVALVPDAAIWLKRLDPATAIDVTPELSLPYQLEIRGDHQGAAEAWASLGAPFDEAMVLAQGDEAAQRRAIAILTRLGASGTIECLKAKMRRDGIASPQMGPRASTLKNPLGLTNRQLDVLRALNDGLSNSEIADRLFVSPKTVDHHVSAILAKLEVASRGEAAAKARNLSIV